MNLNLLAVTWSRTILPMRIVAHISSGKEILEALNDNSLEVLCSSLTLRGGAFA